MHRLVSTTVIFPALTLLAAACCGGYPGGVCPRPEVTFPDTPLRPRQFISGGGPTRDVISESCKAPADCKKAGVPPKCALGVTCDTSQTAPDGSAGVCVFQLDPTCKCYDGDIRYCNASSVGSCTPPGPAGCGISTCSTTTVSTGQWGSCEALPQPQGPCGAPGQACCPAASCSAGATCVGGTCVACGSRGQACCAGSCTGGDVCKSGMCAAAAAGPATACPPQLLCNGACFTTSTDMTATLAGNRVSDSRCGAANESSFRIYPIPSCSHESGQYAASEIVVLPSGTYRASVNVNCGGPGQFLWSGCIFKAYAKVTASADGSSWVPTGSVVGGSTHGPSTTTTVDFHLDACSKVRLHVERDLTEPTHALREIIINNWSFTRTGN